MSLKIHNFGGIIGWNARKYFGYPASRAYLALQFFRRRKLSKQYIDYFYSQETIPMPSVVNIETINRCNSTCAFCSANKNAETRPYMRMDEDLFKKIIDDLADWGYNGHLTLYGNNEPWLDTRIVEFHKYAREKLPNVFIFMSTNGILLDVDKLDAIAPYINQLIVNNYSLKMELYPGVQAIYDHIKANPDKYKDLDVLIQMRYLQEVLTNRAGNSPNKKTTKKVYTEPCLMPFTDMWIIPNGKAGLCCCDNAEVTNYGDLHDMSIKEIWESKQYGSLRKAIANGRDKYPFCKHCDFIDAGLRMDAIIDIMQGNELHGTRQSFFKED